jgi:hypothetical protein
MFPGTNDIKPPELVRVASDTSAVVKLYPLQYDTVSYYYIVIVPADYKKTPDDVRLEEV